MGTALTAWAIPDLGFRTSRIEWWNALNSHLGQAIGLRNGVEMVAVDTPPPPPAAPALPVSAAGGLRAVAVPVEFPFAAQFGADVAVADLPALPDSLRTALTEGLATFVADALDLGVGPIAVGPQATVAALAPATAERRWFRVTFGNIAAAPVVVTLGVEPGVVEAALGSDLVARPVWRGLSAVIKRDVDLTLGRLGSSVADLRRLRAGTLVVLEAPPDGSTCLRVGDLAFRFETTQSGWVCRTVTNIASLPVNRPVGEADALADLSSLPVAIDFDLGRLRVPLGDIETWQPGQVVALDLPEGEVAVTLRANGQVIGSGDLLHIDGRPAVRITRLAFG